MLKKFLTIYKIPLLVSLTLSVVLIALKVERQAFTFTLIVLGSFLGTFILDLDYFIYAYFLEPSKEFSKTLTAFVKHKDAINVFSYIQYHRNDLKDKILQSALFQSIFAALCIFVIASNTGFFVKALVLSVLINSLYRLVEDYFNGLSGDWFWAVKNKPTKSVMYFYTVAIFGVFLYCLSIF